MGNIDFFKKELTKSFQHHISKELVPRALEFVKDELNILLDKKISELKYNNDNTVKPQHTDRKSKNTNSSKRVRQYSKYPV